MIRMRRRVISLFLRRSDLGLFGFGFEKDDGRGSLRQKSVSKEEMRCDVVDSVELDRIVRIRLSLREACRRFRWAEKSDRNKKRSNAVVSDVELGSFLASRQSMDDRRCNR